MTQAHDRAQCGANRFGGVEVGAVHRSDSGGGELRRGGFEPVSKREVLLEIDDIYNAIVDAHKELSDEQYRRIMRVNVDGVVFGVRAVVPSMARQGGGAIVVTASLAGLIPIAFEPVYALTKHAVVGLVRSLVPHLEARGITINAVCPGLTDTPLIGPARTLLEESGFPLIPPADIAAAVLGCVTGRASGQAIVCQAGRPPVPYEFRNVPGPRAEGAEGRLPPEGLRGV